jgi:predicted kinase
VKPAKPKPVLVIITGLPCTGKTTLGKRIADEFGVPFLHKDGIKEVLFDVLGWQDRAWSRRLGVAGYALLYYFVEVQLAAGISCVVESNFHPEHATQQLLALRRRYDFQPVQVQCVTDGQVLYERFVRRAASGERHPGHVDLQTCEDLRPVLLKGRLDALDIGGEVYTVDTTDFSTVDYDALLSAIAPKMRSI